MNKWYFCVLTPNTTGSVKKLKLASSDVKYQSDHRPLLLEFFTDTERQLGICTQSKWFHFEECWSALDEYVNLFSNVGIKGLLWCIWFRRNKMVHSQYFLSTEEVVGWLRSFIAEFKQASTKPALTRLACDVK
ncbi:hypothetical protein ACOSQ2_014293 [Xanthoceras sorbifolium]